MKTKEEFHNLIDKMEDEKILKGYFELIQKLNKLETGELWNSLTEEQRNELMISYEESYGTQNLLSHELIKKQHVKWLKN